MLSKYLKYLPGFLISLAFFVLALISLPDYGINWDEPLHFNRGQAYLRYYLTGKKDYLEIPRYPELKGDSDYMGKMGEQDIYLDSKSSGILSNLNYRRSYYQSDVFGYEYFIKNDGYGHPPASDILAAVFNQVFYHKFGILGDIESYHLFEIFASFVLILGVGIFTCYNFGILASVVATFFLASYPLFFAESHFNIKDPPQTAFFGLTIIFFYFGAIKNNWKILLLSGVSAGLALGTKFNAVFIPFIISPWLVFNTKQISKKLRIFIFILMPPIVLLIFYLFWPYLWKNPVAHFIQMLKFYYDSGTISTGELTDYIYGGFNLFPIYWIAITSPIALLVSFFMGLLFSFYGIFKKKWVYLLPVIWFLLPVIRVTLPGTAVHGGVRHIMEFIPAMAILGGIGISEMAARINGHKKRILYLLIFVSFSFVVWENVRIHPNENVYFNQIVGGLFGAKKNNIPYWGYNYGNVYLQGVNWLNANAPKNAKLALPIVNMVNVPRIKLRPDIDFSNAYLSGPSMQGEYVMEMSNNWKPDNWYAYEFYDKNLFPVYEVKVDGVSLLKIWENDGQYLKNVNIQGQQRKIQDYSNQNGVLNVDLGEKNLLQKLTIRHNNVNCAKQVGGYIRLSLDGNKWGQISETIDYPQIPVRWSGWSDKTFVFLFVNKPARYIFLDTQMADSCILKNPEIYITSLTADL